MVWATGGRLQQGAAAVLEILVDLKNKSVPFLGSISVNSQCASCHTRGTSQYNSQNSGEHSKHSRYDCTVCHNTSKLGNHFGNLATTGFETSPASTIGGGGTMVGSYSGGTCSSVQCHGSERW